MKITNRIACVQPDYLFVIVRRPPGWRPQSPLDVPSNTEVLSVDHVASYEEAQDDLLRCNQISLRHDMAQWAVVQSTGSDL